jgi:hypothetical protein
MLGTLRPISDIQRGDAFEEAAGAVQRSAASATAEVADGCQRGMERPPEGREPARR